MGIWRVTLLALTIIMEARNQPELCKAMVAQVVLNRGGQPSIESTLCQEDQFAVWAPDVYGAGHSLRLAVLECYAAGVFPDDPWCIERWMGARAPRWERPLRIGTAGYWGEVWQIAEAVYEGSSAPPPALAGKTHFDNPASWPGGLPAWMVNCVGVGDHVFCD